MAMGGRVGNLTAEMANVFNIKPILTIKDGKLDLLEKVRTRKKAWSKILELTASGLGSGEIENIFIFHVAAKKEAEEFEILLRETIPCPEIIPLAEFTPGLSVHAGAGMVGVAFTTKE